ncbi:MULTISPECIES: GNAT family N-acetyltransferase [unclassified Treponema]|uniref:GNAT family N-acetyltransferase n=1 Tax=unclassified Treponema TaxID=2638727 RepID=UPI0020A3772B|nr:MULTISPECIES: GNAT family N-acetyltransferase [unclassified Treponema]UTC67067.1 GNAT family N-acetyltransferase [Treponema sp. OMZ 789]UTC69798.1 GNAT family N-acetyltransferase [Treponema sp. OMZ 790]UTC72512.1 GNAT family N-acetyltransferase [Treponema sp. OMZ 791]
MIFAPLTKKNINSFIELILPYEYLCVNLAECLKKQKRFFDNDQDLFTFIKAEAFFSVNTEKKSFIGILLLAAHGVLLHCFPKEIPDDIAQHIKNKFLRQTEPLSVMGEKNTSIHLEKLIHQSLSLVPARFENYKLLTFKTKPQAANSFCIKVSDNLNSKLEFIKPPIEDAESLCPMEIQYNESEVLAPGVKASRESCLKLLKKRINNNALYAVKKDGKYIAKAGINASGFNWNQIGGVFTIPEYRNKGVGAANVITLVNDCAQYKKKCALFVKVKNPSARQMYKKIGFTESIDFRISYF